MLRSTIADVSDLSSTQLVVERPRRLRSDSIQTQAKLIGVAEALFAERGIDGVSLSEINRAAEQGNNSALHYHFGSKEGLFEAIWEKHVSRMNEAVGRALDALPAEPTIADLVDAMVQPFAERFEDPDGGVHYLQIMCQAHANPDQVLFRQIVDGRIPDAYLPLGALLIEACDHVPLQARIRRFHLMASTMLLGLNAIIVNERRKPELTQVRTERLAELKDSLTGLLSGPSSAPA